MPTKNSIKQYQEDGFYHIYNRGVEKRNIFLDKQDYKSFLFFLKIYLLDKTTLEIELKGEDSTRIERNNFAEEVELLTYCLMPNHFHLLIKQDSKDSISRFMKCIATNYSMYFNKRYDRVGKLFQGVYRAALIKDDNYLLHLSRYIHLNPIEDTCQGLTLAESLKKLERFGFSSYLDYLGKRHTKWIKPKFILDILNGPGMDLDNFSSYEDFMRWHRHDFGHDSEAALGELVLE